MHALLFLYFSTNWVHRCYPQVFQFSWAVWYFQGFLQFLVLSQKVWWNQQISGSFCFSWLRLCLFILLSQYEDLFLHNKLHLFHLLLQVCQCLFYAPRVCIDRFTSELTPLLNVAKILSPASASLSQGGLLQPLVQVSVPESLIVCPPRDNEGWILPWCVDLNSFL